MENTAKTLPKVQISKKGEASLREGHPWIYDTEVQPLDGPCKDGSLVEAVSQKGRYLGAGFYNSRSKIRVRIISTNANDRFDRDFFRRRLSHAWEYRKTVMGRDIDCCRLIFGEADYFPGLTVDRFGDILVAQTLSLGIERLKPLLFEELYQLLKEDGQTIRGLYERNDVSIRRLEGMEENKGFFPLPGLPQKMASGTGWTLPMDRKPAFFWTRSITVWPRRRWRPASGCWTALPTPAPLP